MVAVVAEREAVVVAGVDVVVEEIAFAKFLAKLFG